MKNKGKKKLLIAVIAIVLVAAIGAGIWFGTGAGKKEPVNVYPFSYLGMTEYWGDSQESYGPVSTDKIQTVYISDTQTVTEILVKAGDTVKKGDLLMTFDTTLSDLALERKRLDVEKLKLQLEDAENELVRIRNMKPMVIPDYSKDDSSDENQGTKLDSAYRISQVKQYDGSSKDLSIICWIAGSTAIDDALLEEIRLAAEEYQNYNAEKAAEASFAVSQTEGEQPDTPDESDPGDPGDATDPTGETPGGETQEPTKPPYVPFEVNSFYVIFKVTSGDMSLGNRITWQGLKVKRTGGGEFSFQFYDAYGISDHTVTDSEYADTDRPQIDYGSGYTSAQLAQMRADQEKKIKQLEFDVKMAEADYKIMQTEVQDGNVYSQIDGEVVSVLTEEEAKQQMQPIVKVSGGGGYYISGSVSELEKDNLQIGQEVTINDWQSGMVYTGEVTAIGDFPDSDGYWNGMGNPNTTYYPFTVFVDGSADLQAGYHVSIMYSAGTSQHGIYLEKPFLRTEQGRSYVYVRGEDGLLEKRYVTTGKSLWGSYTEVLSGLSEEDFLAFPYGKEVKEGAPTKESDLSELYSY